MIQSLFSVCAPANTKNTCKDGSGKGYGGCGKQSIMPPIISTEATEAPFFAQESS